MQSFNHSVCSGFCRTCKQDHFLPTNATIQAKAVELMELFEKEETIDIFSKTPDERYTTAPLFDEPRGKMFGLLQGINSSGKQVFLYAFSGQYNGSWSINGWVPPLFNPDVFTQINAETEIKIKKITQHLAKLDRSVHQHLTKILKTRRKKMSQQLMKDIHAIYLLHNFNGECKKLEEVFIGEAGMPTGTGDCCAPKLLNAAARQSLQPIAIAEFYWGKENRSKTKFHKTFYPSCKDKCGPILGFLLCGADHLNDIPYE